MPEARVSAAEVESARREWEEGSRRLDEQARDRDAADRLLVQVDAVTDELRRRVGGTFTLAELTRVYAEAGYPERWRLLRYDVGHQETAEGRQEIIAFLQRFL